MFHLPTLCWQWCKCLHILVNSFNSHINPIRYYSLSLFFFLGLHLRHLEVPR